MTTGGYITMIFSVAFVWCFFLLCMRKTLKSDAPRRSRAAEDGKRRGG